ncbi:MAG: hypothetical protein AAGI34_02300 [Pseudomonadota bacterium]
MAERITDREMDLRQRLLEMDELIAETRLASAQAEKTAVESRLSLAQAEKTTLETRLYPVVLITATLGGVAAVLGAIVALLKVLFG